MEDKFRKLMQDFSALSQEQRAIVNQHLGINVSRAELAARLGSSYGGDRKLYDALGYPLNLTHDHYYARYARQELAKAIIDRPVKATWRGGLDLQESVEQDTPFQSAWREISRRLGIIEKWFRADRMAGIAEFSVLFLGLSGNGPLDEEPTGNPKLMYLQPFDQRSVRIVEWEEDPRNERFGLPLVYRLQIKTRSSLNERGGVAAVPNNVDVHWSRIIHIADDTWISSIYGTPRLEAVYNRLQDLEQIVGGSSESFWRQVFPGMIFKVNEDADETNYDKGEFEDRVDKFIHQFRRYLRLGNMDFEAVKPDIASPLDHIKAELMLISSVTGIPMRMLTGSEMGERASQEDRKSWAERIDERREYFVEPIMIRQTIDRFVSFGILPEPEDDYEIIWAPLYSPTEKEQSETTLNRTKALASYAQSMAEAIVPRSAFLKKEMGYDEGEIEEMDEMVEAEMTEEQDGFGETETSTETEGEGNDGNNRDQ
jgi:hypothetical protein